MGELFALQGSAIPQTFDPVFREFLKRLTDKVVKVRMLVLEHVKLCLLSDPFRGEAPKLIGKYCISFMASCYFSCIHVMLFTYIDLGYHVRCTV